MVLNRINLHQTVCVNVLKVSQIKVRTMFTSKAANKAVNLNLIRQHGASSRNMSCYHGTTLKAKAPKPKVTDTDTSGFHKMLIRTTCPEKDCKTVNCADPHATNATCPGRTAQQNQVSIPTTTQVFVSEIVGNTTSKIPPLKTGFIANSTQNYAGQPKAQAIVVETNPVKVDSNNLDVDQQSTAFVQGHHNILDKNLP